MQKLLEIQSLQKYLHKNCYQLIYPITFAKSLYWVLLEVDMFKTSIEEMEANDVGYGYSCSWYNYWYN